ncbi:MULTISPECIES: hypothetical protein [Stenotrophomonas]|uniref:hypothetical protein n=1 Tax=Stenotrophomonas TaxID=40323 RepID=UPI0007705632|nr:MULTISPECIES: hypothetical protein [Stenotrophomonas]AMJ56473.1 hypothetical protein AXG53_07290 [Stenotrophomonas sp. KCTC 12332]
MTNTSARRAILYLACTFFPMAALASPLPPNWQMLPSTQQQPEKGLPAALQAPLLAKNQRPLGQVELVVSLPFDQVLPVVQASLAPLGTFNAPVQRTRVAYMEHGWGNVLIARRPELKADFIRRYRMPALRTAVEQGALLAEELPIREQRLQRDPTVDALSDKMTELQVDFASWQASAEHKHGLLGRAKSTIEVRVMQIDEALGKPATAITLSRVDDWPNPKGGVIDQLREFNVMGGGPSPRLMRRAVPDALFTPVYDALRKLPAAALQIGMGAGDWQPPLAADSRIVEPTLTAPGSAKDAASAERLLKTESGQYYDMRPLADGSVLLLSGHPDALWRWAPGMGTTPQRLWQAEGDAGRAGLSTDLQGRNAWLAVQQHMVTYAVGQPTATSHPLQWAANVRQPISGGWNWLPDAQGRPVPYDHALDGRNPIREVLRVLQLQTTPPAEGAAWIYAPRFDAPRQGVLAGYPGNTRIKPVRWDGPGQGFWVEDPAGLTELDAASGRVSRVLSLPRRFGKADGNDDAGMAQWVPAPLGSAAGGWIAVGFVLMEGERRNPGMHVIDVASGKLKHSLVLPGLNALNAAAASADGRLLALGSNDGSTPVLAIWNLDSGKSLSLNPSRSACWDLRQLHWAPQGDALVGLCGDGVARWPLPPDWHAR